MYRFTIRDVLWLTALAAVVVWWLIDHQRLQTAVARLRSENSRLTQGPDWASMDRIMDEYALRWMLIQNRERELGMEQTPNPFDGPSEPGDVVPSLPAVTFPAATHVPSP
jgi:hypothetical protein